MPNKWDAVEKNDKTVNQFTQKVRQILSFMPYAEITFISAVTGQRLFKLYELIDAVYENHAMRVATGVLNETFGFKGTPLKFFIRERKESK